MMRRLCEAPFRCRAEEEKTLSGSVAGGAGATEPQGPPGATGATGPAGATGTLEPDPLAVFVRSGAVGGDGTLANPFGTVTEVLVLYPKTEQFIFCAEIIH